MGFETLFFRLIDTSMRSNSYSFAHMLSLYLLLYGISRFVIEFYRGDISRGTIGGLLSTSQFVSALLVPLSLAMLMYLRRGARTAKA